MPELTKELLSEIEKRGWIVGHKIGDGGGGIVLFSYKTILVEALVDFLKKARHMTSDLYQDKAMSMRLIDNAFESARSGNGLAALKMPHIVLERGSIDEKTGKRLKREIKAMTSIDHSALIKILDHDTADLPKWFVMKYYPGGNLAGHVEGFKGNPLKTLVAIRPIIEGVSLLHKQAYIHRDIKPNNIFLDSEGRLILGDFGIVFIKEGDTTPLTQPGNLEFSRDWIPDWVRNRDLDAYSQKVDVFMLCKVIYYMVSGGKKVLASQIDEEEFDLTKLFPKVSGIDLIYDLVCQCVTNKEQQCKIDSAGALLVALDPIIGSLQEQLGAQLLFNTTLRDVQLLIPMTGGLGAEVILETQIYLSRPTRRFIARAGILLTVRGIPISASLKYRFGKKTSEEAIIKGDNTRAKVWTNPISLLTPNPLLPGWYELTIEGWSDQVESAWLADFTLYAD